MPFNLKQIASISGMSGLYRVVKPTRNGIIIESLAEQPERSVAQARHKVSLLDEISIYTTDEQNMIPLAEVFDRIREQYDQELPVNAKSSGAELSGFLEEIIPDYDQERVYTSDMKKIVAWYTIVSKFLPYSEEEAAEPAAEEEPTAAAEQEKGKEQ